MTAVTLTDRRVERQRPHPFRFRLHRAGICNVWQYGDQVFHEGAGCEECGGTGYLGRTAVAELLDMSDRIRQMILERRPTGEIKQAASEALLAAGGTITHHHAVGRDHRRWYDRQRPDAFAAALRAAKSALDPAGVLNPGVLIDPVGR